MPSFRKRSNAIRLTFLVLQGAGLVTGWIVWGATTTECLRLSLAYVLGLWIVAGGVTLGTYLAFSLAAFSDLLAEAVLASANAMWLIPGVLLLAARSPIASALGLAALVNSMRLLMLIRAPQGEAIPMKAVALEQSETRLFLYQPSPPGLISGETLRTMFGAVILYVGVYALAGQYPLLAATCFAAATALYVRMSVMRGALEPRTSAGKPFAAIGLLLTLLWTVSLTAVLLNTEIVRETPPEVKSWIDIDGPPQGPGITRRTIERLAHVPPTPKPAKGEAQDAPQVAANLVDPSPAAAATEQDGMSGVVLRPKAKPVKQPSLSIPGARFKASFAQPLAIRFTGEYQLFRTSSGTLPPGAIVDTGSPLDSIYKTTNGGPMRTVAVQTFEPPIDLTNCAKVMVLVKSAETMPLLASMQLVAERSVEDGGTELMGTKPGQEETLEFQVPHTRKSLMIRAIRIAFERPAYDSEKNARIAVQGFTLEGRR